MGIRILSDMRLMKNARTVFEKTHFKRPILRVSHQFGDSSYGHTGIFFYDKEKDSMFWFWYNGSHQWYQYKLNAAAGTNANPVNVTPGGTINDTIGGVVKYNNKYFIFTNSGMMVMDATTMTITATYTTYQYYGGVNIQLFGNIAYYKAFQGANTYFAKINLDFPATAPTTFGMSTSGYDNFRVDASQTYFYSVDSQGVFYGTLRKWRVSDGTSAGTVDLPNYGSSQKALCIHPKTGNVLVLTNDSSGNTLILTFNPSTMTLVSTTTIPGFTSTGGYLRIDATSNHIMVWNAPWLAVLDMSYLVLWYSNESSPSEKNVMVSPEGYMSLTWTQYNSVSSYANKVYELEILT